MYAVDGSLYEVEPLLVVAPRDEDDVVAVVDYAKEHGLPLLARGAGTSLAGQTVNQAIVLDYSRYMHAILEIDPEARLARVQPGVVLDQFNRELAEHDLKFGPDVSTSTHATLGGMIGNSSAGAYSLVHGMTDEHVEAMRVVLADGSRQSLGRGEPIDLVKAIAAIVEPLASEIDEKFPKVMRNTGGYRLDDVLAELRASPSGTMNNVNLARFLAGSEGTLALMSEATVRLVEKPT
jgi:FAD/FMN-containing dehydrogenase